MKKVEEIIELLDKCLDEGLSPIDAFKIESFLEEQQSEIESLKFEIEQNENNDYEEWLNSRDRD